MQNARTLEQLIKEAQLGNKAAVEEIVERFQPLVWATARRFASNTDLADDFAQEGTGSLTAIYNYRPGAVCLLGMPKGRYIMRCGMLEM